MVENSSHPDIKTRKISEVEFFFKEHISNDHIFSGVCIKYTDNAAFCFTFNNSQKLILIENYWSDEIIYDNREISSTLHVGNIKIDKSILNKIEKFLKSHNMSTFNIQQYLLISASITEYQEVPPRTSYVLTLARQKSTFLEDNLIVSLNEKEEVYDIETYEELDFTHFLKLNKT